jgi:hypothetical protein
MDDAGEPRVSFPQAVRSHGIHQNFSFKFQELGNGRSRRRAIARSCAPILGEAPL